MDYYVLVFGYIFLFISGFIATITAVYLLGLLFIEVAQRMYGRYLFMYDTFLLVHFMGLIKVKKMKLPSYKNLKELIDEE